MGPFTDQIAATMRSLQLRCATDLGRWRNSTCASKAATALTKFRWCRYRLTKDRVDPKQGLVRSWKRKLRKLGVTVHKT